MKTIIYTYTFNAAFKQLTFSAYTNGIVIGKIWYIKNITRNVDVYKAGQDDTGFQVVGFNNETLVLPNELDVTDWTDDDHFLIIYEAEPFFTDISAEVQKVEARRMSTSYETNHQANSIIGGNDTNVTLWTKNIWGPYIKTIRVHLSGGSGTIRFYTVNDPLSAFWGYDVEWVLVHTNETKFGSGTFPAPSGGNSIAIEIDVSSISNIKMDISGFSGGTLSYGVVESQKERIKGTHLRSRLLSAGSINATVVKGSPAKLYRVHVYNNSAAVKFLKLYNKTSAPAPGTDTSLLIEKIPIAPNSGRVLEYDEGFAFPAGLSFAITGAIADNDATAVTASDVEVTIFYR